MSADLGPRVERNWLGIPRYVWDIDISDQHGRPKRVHISSAHSFQPIEVTRQVLNYVALRKADKDNHNMWTAQHDGEYSNRADAIRQSWRQDKISVRGLR